MSAVHRIDLALLHDLQKHVPTKLNERRLQMQLLLAPRVIKLNMRYKACCHDVCHPFRQPVVGFHAEIDNSAKRSCVQLQRPPTTAVIQQHHGRPAAGIEEEGEGVTRVNANTS